MKTATITILLSMCTGVMFFTSIQNINATPNISTIKLTDNEMSLLVGASGFFQTCGATISCSTGPASCASVGCQQIFNEGWPACVQTGSSSGCSSGGNWLNCKWAWCLWCWEGGAGRCGFNETAQCGQIDGYCTSCFINTSSNPCQNDCS